MITLAVILATVVLLFSIFVGGYFIGAVLAGILPRSWVSVAITALIGGVWGYVLAQLYIMYLNGIGVLL